MSLFPKSETRIEVVTADVPYPFPVPILPLSERAAKALSSNWLAEEVQYVRNILALVETVLNNKSGDPRSNLFDSGSIAPLLPVKGEFAHPMAMTNGRAKHNQVELNPWRVWDIFGSAITCLHELAHRANKDFTFANNPIEVASREIRAHRFSITDAQDLSGIVSRVPAPSEAVKEIWINSVALREASHTLQCVTYEILQDVQLLLKSRIEALRPHQIEVRNRIMMEFSKGSLKGPFQLLGSLWRAGEGIPPVGSAIEAFLRNSDISALLSEPERERWNTLVNMHREAGTEFSRLASLSTASIERFGPAKVVPPRRIGSYFD